VKRRVSEYLRPEDLRYHFHARVLNPCEFIRGRRACGVRAEGSHSFDASEPEMFRGNKIHAGKLVEGDGVKTTDGKVEMAGLFEVERGNCGNGVGF